MNYLLSFTANRIGSASGNDDGEPRGHSRQPTYAERSDRTSDKPREVPDTGLSTPGIANRPVFGTDGPVPRARGAACAGSPGVKPECVIRYADRPFNVLRLYLEREFKLLDEKREGYRSNVFPGSIRISMGQRIRKAYSCRHQVMHVLVDHHLVESHVGMFPRVLGVEMAAPNGLWCGELPNPSSKAANYLADSGTPLPG